MIMILKFHMIQQSNSRNSNILYSNSNYILNFTVLYGTVWISIKSRRCFVTSLVSQKVLLLNNSLEIIKGPDIKISNGGCCFRRVLLVLAGKTSKERLQKPMTEGEWQSELRDRRNSGPSWLRWSWWLGRQKQVKEQRHQVLTHCRLNSLKKTFIGHHRIFNENSHNIWVPVWKADQPEQWHCNAATLKCKRVSKE